MRTDGGDFTFQVPTDVAELTATGVWLRARRFPALGVICFFALVVIAVGVRAGSVTVVVVGATELLLFPLLAALSVRRQRTTYARRLGRTWGVLVGPSGVRVDAVLTSTSFAWAFFAGWTIHRGQLVLVHSGPPMRFVAFPIAVVPDDEWQQVTTLLYEKVGPARTPDSVRGSRLNRATSRRLGESATAHPF